MANEKKGFKLRSFTSFSLVISTVIMSWSGFILYVAPPGRVANWGTWQLMLFTKAEWQALHTIFSYIFFILAVIHLFFVNWKTFLTYFKSKIKAGLNRKWELFASIAVSGIIFIGTLRSWTPFGPVMSFGEKVKESWEGDFIEPPVLHMEIYTLEQVSELLDSVPPAELITTLKDNNYIVNDPANTLKEIADENNTTPSVIYDLLAKKYSSTTEQSSGEVPQGVGKYTIKMVSESSGKNISSMIKILNSNGIEANEGTSLKSISDQMGVTPKEIYNLLTGQ